METISDDQKPSVPIILRGGGAVELDLKDSVSAIAEISEEVGLKTCKTYFDMVPAETMYEYGAYGIPGRFGHWTHGRDYYRMKTMYDHGFSKIYELVINDDPAYAYLLETNPPIANKLVVAHVVGHVDFFQKNMTFSHTNRRMVETVQQTAARFAEYEYLYGIDAVEAVIDAAISLSKNIDTHPKGFNRLPKDQYVAESLRRSRDELKGKGISTSEYDDIWSLGAPKKEEPNERPKITVPYEADPDLMWVISEFSPILMDWQKDILLSVRAEQQYFIPQMLTKIMNEGWASLWHTRITRELIARGLVSDDEAMQYARLHSGVISGNRRNLNPYGLGLRIWEDIDDKYHGRVDWGEEREIDRWGEVIDPESYVGTEYHDIFRVRETMVDQGFLRNFLSGRIIRELDLYGYRREGDRLVVEEKDPQKIREGLVASMDRGGLPSIVIPKGGANYTSSRELYLEHEFEGEELDEKYAQETLKRVFYLWGRPVHLQARIRGSETTIHCSEGPTVLTV